MFQIQHPIYGIHHIMYVNCQGDSYMSKGKYIFVGVFVCIVCFGIYMGGNYITSKTAIADNLETREDVSDMEEYFEKVNAYISETNRKYVNANFQNDLKLFALDYNINGNVSNANLAQPYIVYNLNEQGYNNAISYPIYISDKICGIYVVSGTEPYRGNISTDLVEQFNQIDYLNKNYVFYCISDNQNRVSMWAENEEGMIPLQSSADTESLDIKDEFNIFLNQYNFQDRLSYMSEKLENGFLDTKKEMEDDQMFY